jgi:hypothetical protein
VNPAAYDAYLRGLLYFVNEFTNPDSLRKPRITSKRRFKKTPTSRLLTQD